MWPVVLLLFAGCADAPAPEEPAPAEGETCQLPAGACTSCTLQAVPMPGIHHPQGEALMWTSNPPAIGPHYPVWAPWAQVYAQPVPRGNWVHNLEHGGVVLLYRCPSGCDDVVQGLSRIGRGLPQDPLCTSTPPINARWLVTPDPLLPEDTVVAAAAWGFAYRANCLDEASLRAFITAHYAMGTEDFCSDGAIAWQ